MSRFNRARVFWSVCVLCVACAWNSTASTSAAQTQAATAVTATNVKFTPADVTINVGDTVTWTNTEGTHNVVADDGSFTSGTPTTGFTYTHTFATAGTYQYYCVLHGRPGGLGMTGVVRVVGPASYRILLPNVLQPNVLVVPQH